MHKIVLYCKTFHHDVKRVVSLVESVKKHNKDNIPFYISIPKEDETIFKDNIDTNYVNIVFDEDIYDFSFLSKSDKINGGWYLQQVVKASFWKLNLCENYVCLDSDSYFIKDFHVSDFMYDVNTPYTVMHEQKELFEFTSRYKDVIGHDPKIGFEETREPIMKALQREGKFYDFGPSPVIWSCKVWRLLEETQLKPQGYTFFDLIKAHPSEFTWYGEFLLKTLSIVIVPIQPLFKVLHFKPQYDFYKQVGFTEEMFSENYFGIVIQSNFTNTAKY
jgi:hypothetical protein